MPGEDHVDEPTGQRPCDVEDLAGVVARPEVAGPIGKFSICAEKIAADASAIA